MEKLQKIYQWPFKLGYGEKIKFESKYKCLKYQHTHITQHQV